MKKALSLILILCIALIQSGCYDSREIDETAYIIAIGIDNSDDGEFKYTFQFAAPLAISGEGGGGSGEGKKDEGGEGEKSMLDSNNPGVKNTVVKAADFYVARNMLNNFLSKNIDMSHLKMIVFSSAVEYDGFIQHSQLFRREREVRPHTVLAVSEGPAEEFLRCVNPELEANTAKYYELLSLRSNNIYAPSKRLHEFTDELLKNGSSVLPLARVSKPEDSAELSNIRSDNKKDGWIQANGERISSSKSELKGMMLFKNNNISGTMSGDSALIYNILQRDIKEFTLSIENRHSENKTMSFNVKIPSAAHYHVDRTENNYVISVNQRLCPEYIGDGLPDGYSSQEELMSDFCTEVEKQIQSFMYSTSREFAADIMQTGSCLKKQSFTLDEWNDLNWQEKYRHADFSVNIST